MKVLSFKFSWLVDRISLYHEHFVFVSFNTKENIAYVWASSELLCCYAGFAV